MKTCNNNSQSVCTLKSGLIFLLALMMSVLFVRQGRAQAMDGLGWTQPPGLVWSTYFGDGISEAPEAMAVAPDGTVVLAGFTQVPGTWTIDIVVIRVSAEGELLNVRYVDGGSVEGAFALGIDAHGIITVAGQTMSGNFPVTEDAMQGAYGGGFADAFVMRLNLDLEILYSTFLGGNGEDAIVDLAVDDTGRVAVCGYTGSTDLPVTEGAWQAAHAGGVLDAFVALLVPDAGGSMAVDLAYLTYLGGSKDDSDFDPDDPYGWSLDQRLLRQAVAFAANGRIVTAGMTWSEDFPVTPGAVQTEHSELIGEYPEDADMYVTVLNPQAVSYQGPGLGQLVYSTYLGGVGRDVSEDIVVRGAVLVTVVGLSRAPDFPVTANAWKGSLGNAIQNGVVVQLLPIWRIPQRAQLLYSTYLGGTTRDAATGVCQMPSGDIVVGGVTISDDFPTTDGTQLRGETDVFLTRLDPRQPPSQQMVFSTLIGGSANEDVAVGPVLNGVGGVFMSGDTTSDDLPGVIGTAHDGVGYDIFVGKYHLGVSDR